MEPYEIVEHTAEIGIRARGSTREELFTHMAQGVFSLIVPPEQVRPAQKHLLRVESDGWERLLLAWLKDLLYLFDTRRFLPSSFRILHLEPGLLEAEIYGEILDTARHSLDKEIKSVTYCDLELRQEGDGTWVAQVILDI